MMTDAEFIIWITAKIEEEKALARSFQRPRGGFSTNQRYHEIRADAFKQAMLKYIGA